jgi:hypothetical protein
MQIQFGGQLVDLVKLKIRGGWKETVDDESASMTRRGKPKTSPVWRSGNFCLCIVPV